jgi:hypothetical protein
MPEDRGNRNERWKKNSERICHLTVFATFWGHLENLLIYFLLLFNIFHFAVIIVGRETMTTAIRRVKIANDWMNDERREGDVEGWSGMFWFLNIITRVTQTESENTERERKTEIKCWTSSDHWWTSDDAREREKKKREHTVTLIWMIEIYRVTTS